MQRPWIRRLALSVIAVTATAGPVVAQTKPPAVGSPDWVRDRDFEAIAISRVAARLCPNFAFDETQESFGLSFHKLRTWADIPKEVVQKAMDGFARDPDAACDYAWANYGPNARTSQYRFLSRVIRNPF